MNWSFEIAKLRQAIKHDEANLNFQKSHRRLDRVVGNVVEMECSYFISGKIKENIKKYKTALEALEEISLTYPSPKKIEQIRQKYEF